MSQEESNKRQKFKGINSGRKDEKMTVRGMRKVEMKSSDPVCRKLGFDSIQSDQAL